MRKRNENSKISVQAVAGTEVVILGFNATQAGRKGLLGFAVQRYDHQRKRKIWLRGTGRSFEGEKSGQDSRTAPIQEFMWGDYTVAPGKAYTYTVVPVYGKPGALKNGDSVRVKITTEKNDDAKHGIFFNRGVAGSQAYSRQFQSHRRWYHLSKFGREYWQELIKPEDVPDRKAWKWLSRGLEEAMLKFIGQAKGEDYGIRASVYELTHLPIVQAFADAIESGADVKVIHHSKPVKQTVVKRGKEVVTYSPDSVGRAAEATIRQVGIKSYKNTKAWEDAFILRTNTTISHNKFIILLKKDKPIAVWTGSTNFTAGGIFGQSNVGHLVRDEKVAARYYDYWQKLSGDPKRRSLKSDPEDAGLTNWNIIHQPDLEGPPKPNSITPIFSPRPTADMLQWYADQLGAAKQSVHFTAAFGVSQEIGKKLVINRKSTTKDPYQSYILIEGKPSEKQSVNRKKTAKEKGREVPVDYYDFVKYPTNRIAYGDLFKKSRNAEGLKIEEESLTGLNTNVDYLHTKYLLIDPLSDNPTVITGSANFSEPSTTKNDENMLIIQGNTRVADIFLTEFMRLFNHFHGRNVINEMGPKDSDDWEPLKADNSWTDPHYKKGSQEEAERLLFA